MGGDNNHIRNTERWYEPLLGNNGIDGACSTMFKKSDFFEHCNIDEYIEHGFATFDHPTWLSLSFRKNASIFRPLWPHIELSQHRCQTMPTNKRTWALTFRL